MSGFLRYNDDLPRQFAKDKAVPVFYDCQITTILYETKPEIIARLLPPGLEPLDKPYVLLCFNDFQHINFARPYFEPTIQIPCQHKGNYGNYVLGMTLNDDVPTMGGHLAGYPKKVGHITAKWDGDRFTGTCARHGIEYMKMDVDLGQAPNDPDLAKILPTVSGAGLHHVEGREHMSMSFTFQAPQFMTWDTMMKTSKKATLLYCWKTSELYEPARYGHADIAYQWSDDDPWAEVEVVRILGAQQAHCKVVMVDQVPTDEQVPMKDFAPWANLGWDAKPSGVYAGCDEPEWDHDAYRDAWAARGDGVRKTDLTV